MQGLDFSIFRVRHSLFSGNAATLLTGSGMDFRELVEYDSSQSTKHIDWKASARSGKMKVRTYHGDHDVRLHILIDKGASMGFGEYQKTKMDLALDIIQTLTNSAQSQGNSVGCITFDTQKISYFPPTRSPGITREIFPHLKNFSEEITDTNRLLDCFKSEWIRKIHKGIAVLLVDAIFPISPEFQELCRKNTVFVCLLEDSVKGIKKGFLRDIAGSLISLESKKSEEKEKENFLKKLFEIGAISERFVAGESSLPKLINLFHRAHGKVRS